MAYPSISNLRASFIVVAIVIACSAQMRAPVQLQVPSPDDGTESLAARAKAQIETISQFKVFYEFQFVDRIKESGISFRYQAVADALESYKAIHYDHGSAIAAADVDGDVRPD